MRTNPLLPGALALAVGIAATARAGTFTWTWDGVGLEVPDAPFVGDPVTVSDTRTVTTGYATGIAEIRDSSVWLRVVGSDGAGGAGTMWNGDLSVRLTHEDGTSVTLLNRVGRTAASADGSPGNGFDVHFVLGALDDIHAAAPASGTTLVGEFQADGRSGNPSTVLDTSARDATLDSLLAAFAAGNRTPDGQWTLSVTDLSTGSLARVEAWGMSLEVVPEPETTAVVGAAGLLAFALWRRRTR